MHYVILLLTTHDRVKAFSKLTTPSNKKKTHPICNVRFHVVSKLFSHYNLKLMTTHLIQRNYVKTREIGLSKEHVHAPFTLNIIQQSAILGQRCFLSVVEWGCDLKLDGCGRGAGTG